MPDPRYAIFDGLALEDPVYRIVDACPPSEDDFRSYTDLGRTFPSWNFFRATGVSCYLTLEDARDANQKFNLGSAAAEVDIRDNRIFWCKSGGPGHITVWAPAAALFSFVTSCTYLDYAIPGTLAEE